MYDKCNSIVLANVFKREGTFRLLMKEAYAKLQAKYKLPEYDAINADFEICLIEQEDFLIRSVVRKMMEKMEMYAKLLEELIHPESSLSAMYECNSLSAEQKKTHFRLYKRLLYFHRLALELDLQYDESAYAKFILDFYAEWQDLRKDLIGVLASLKKSWTRDTAEKLDSGYFG